MMGRICSGLKLRSDLIDALLFAIQDGTAICGAVFAMLPAPHVPAPAASLC